MTDYSKLREGCPLIDQIDARGSIGYAQDKTWVKLLQDAEQFTMAGLPELKKEYEEALAKALETDDEKDYKKVYEISRRGRAIHRAFCKTPSS